MRSLIGWPGGKKVLAKTIVALLPKHVCYVEPFGGAAAVLFAKEPSVREVYNDLDGRLVSLFRVVKYHPDAFLHELKLTLNSRCDFEDFLAQPGLTDIQRAARFYYTIRLSFGYKGKHFGLSRTELSGILRERLIESVAEIRDRLERVTIECRDFADVISTHDGPDTCFYVDPPYRDTWSGYGPAFSQEDHARLADVLSACRGKWLLTYNRDDWVIGRYREMGAHLRQVTTTYSIGRGRRGTRCPRAVNLIVTNYRLSRAALAAAPRAVRPLPKTARRRNQK